MAIDIHPGDNRVTLRRLIDEGVRVHSVVTDPPYGLTSTLERFGNSPRTESTMPKAGQYARLSKGFMGKKWDTGEVSFDPEFWKLIWEILLPGGYVFAFSGSRTGHWQACAMEMAGFVMHPMHGWVFGQGFPKAHKAGVEGWDGWAYGTQAQKPALEPIYLGQKPFSEKTGAENLLKHGVGAVNIDGCRVPLCRDDALQSGVAHSSRALDTADNEGKWGFKAVDRAAGLGRHPANLILDGSPEVVALFPESKGQLAAVGPQHGSRETVHAYGNYGPRPDTPPRGDSGSAARFFHQFPPDADPIIYQAKAGKADRAGSKHPTVKPIALMQYLIRHITPPGGTVLDPFAGSGTTGEAAQREGFDCILMEAEPEYVEFLQHRFPEPDRMALAAGMMS